jgi:hypothetical protein
MTNTYKEPSKQQNDIINKRVFSSQFITHINHVGEEKHSQEHERTRVQRCEWCLGARPGVDGGAPKAPRHRITGKERGHNVGSTEGHKLRVGNDLGVLARVEPT